MHAETVDDVDGKLEMQNMEANEEIGTRILEYVLAQYSLSRGLKYMDKKEHM